MREVNISTIKIVLHDAASVNAWCEVLNCNEKELLSAIAVIGDSAKAVDEYLEMHNKKEINKVCIDGE